MTGKVPSDVKIQRNYYAETALRYDGMHLHRRDEHYLALSFMVATLQYYNIRSVLDIGSGTGRVVDYVKEQRPEIKIVGVEPVRELREMATAGGYPPGSLSTGTR